MKISVYELTFDKLSMHGLLAVHWGQAPNPTCTMFLGKIIKINFQIGIWRKKKSWNILERRKRRKSSEERENEQKARKHRSYHQESETKFGVTKYIHLKLSVN